MKALHLAGAMTLLAAASAAPAANLLVNGSFETSGGYQNLAGAGNTSITGWKTANEGVEWFDPTVYALGPAYDGLSIVDLSWYTSTGTPGGAIEQSFATVAGGRYEVSFYGTNTNYAGRDGQGVVDVSIDGGALASFNLVHVAPTFALADWTRYAATFVATGTTTTLRLANGQNAYEHFTLIDGASVEAVPEPATWALMIGGFAAVGVMARRRRAGVTA